MKINKLIESRKRLTRHRNTLDAELGRLWEEIMHEKFGATPQESRELPNKFEFKEYEIVGVKNTNPMCEDSMKCSMKLFNALLGTEVALHLEYDDINQVMEISAYKHGYPCEEKKPLRFS